MNNKTGNYCVAAVAIKADLSGLTLEKNGVLNGALVGLPTTEPSVTGALWLSGSAGNGSKYLMVFTG